MWGIIATWTMSKEGIEKAEEILKMSGDSGDAIEKAIKEVEDFEYYKSVGYGGLPNEEGEVELDAGYMDGDTLQRRCNSICISKWFSKKKHVNFSSKNTLS